MFVIVRQRGGGRWFGVFALTFRGERTWALPSLVAFVSALCVFMEVSRRTVKDAKF